MLSGSLLVLLIVLVVFGLLCAIIRSRVSLHLFSSLRLKVNKSTESVFFLSVLAFFGLNATLIFSLIIIIIIIIIIKVEKSIDLHGNPISDLRSVTCHMGSRSVTCHLTQVNTPHLTPGWHSIYLPWRDGRLS